MPARSNEHLKYYLLILLSMTIGSYFFFQVVMDDAFIPIRYGYNLIHYGVWNWNTGKQHVVEGYTTFIYAVLSLLPACVPVNPLIPVKIFGLICFIMIIRRLYISTPDKKLALFVILIFVTNWQTYVHVYSGLETPLWVWLIIEILYLLDSDTYNNQTKLWIICLLLPLTRPEGILISAFAFFYLRFYKKIKISLTPFIICTAIGIFYFIARYYYFGLFFPLTFYQKSIKNNTGLLNLIINIYSSWHYILCLAVITLALRKNRFFTIVSCFFLFLFVLVYGTSLLTMNYADRFSWQTFFPVILFGIASVSNLSIEKIKVKYIGVSLVIFVFGKGIYSNHSLDYSSIGENLFTEYYYSKAHLTLGKHFRKLNDPSIKVFFGEAGIFPYYAHVDCYDTEGLADKYLSVHPINKAYIDSIEPDVFLYLIFKPVAEFNSWAKTLTPQSPNYYYNYLLNNAQYDKIGYVNCVDNNIFIGICINKYSKKYAPLRMECMEAIRESENNSFRFKKFLKYKYFRMFAPI